MELSLDTLVDLQLHGVMGQGLEPARRGGAGPANTRAFMIDGRCLMVPVRSQSKWSLRHKDGVTTICGNDMTLFAPLVRRPAFYDLVTANGIPYHQIAQLHGRDCLASTVFQQCARYASPDTRCRFCALGRTLDSGATILRKSPAQLAEVAAAAKKLDHVTHVTLTSGTTVHRDIGTLYLGQCALAICEGSGLPSQIQFEPPENFEVFRELRRLRVANVCMHVESLDESIRRRITPGKAELPLHLYFQAFEEAVHVFGRNKVGTYIILGLGEDRDLTLRQTLQLVKMGVYPNLVPLFPLPGTPLADAPGPDPDYLKEMYEKVGGALRAAHLTRAGALAGCGRCGGCSLLQYTEASDDTDRRATGHTDSESVRKAELRVAATETDIAACHAIRRQVFCEEQGIFPEDDSDEHDKDAVHILATVGGEPAGVVRCYCRRDTIWVGGRLAVLPGFRGTLGTQLVRKAVQVMEARPDVTRFFAIVQVQNIRFFKSLRWKALGRPFICNGTWHQVMEKPLNKGEHR